LKKKKWPIGAVAVFQRAKRSGSPFRHRLARGARETVNGVT